MLLHGPPSLKLGARLRPFRSNPRLQLTPGAGHRHTLIIRSSLISTAVGALAIL